MKEKKIKFEEKEVKKVNWKQECGFNYPFCPYCGEPAYEKDHCVFCGRKYKMDI